MDSVFPRGSRVSQEVSFNCQALASVRGIPLEFSVILCLRQFQTCPQQCVQAQVEWSSPQRLPIVDHRTASSIMMSRILQMPLGDCGQAESSFEDNIVGSCAIPHQLSVHSLVRGCDRSVVVIPGSLGRLLGLSNCYAYRYSLIL